MRTHPPSRLSAVSEDLPRSRVGFHGSLVRPSASGRVARFWLRRNDNFGQTVFVIRFSPVADDVGLTRRCQRSICVTAALPVPMRGRKIHFAADDLRPMKVAAMFARPTPAMIHATLSCPFNATTTELASIANMMKNANHCPTATVL